MWFFRTEQGQEGQLFTFCYQPVFWPHQDGVLNSQTHNKETSDSEYALQNLIPVFLKFFSLFSWGIISNRIALF